MHTRDARVCADYGHSLHVFGRNDQPEPVLCSTTAERPVVGDWVQLDAQDRVIGWRERTSQIVRLKSDGSAQVLAANVDQVWLVYPLDREPVFNRWERFARFAISQGFRPVVVLSKLDLCPNPHLWLSVAFSMGFGEEIHLVSSHTGVGIEELAARLEQGKTALLLGQSGAGKSSLVNVLCEDRQKVGPVRTLDHRGRHITTVRRLIPTIRGGYVLDTPGLRELGWEGQEDLPDEFRPWAEQCRFRDCSHDADEGCAVIAAARQGLISPQSLAHWQKLRRESAYQQRREDPRMAANSKRRWKAIHKAFRQQTRRRNREEEAG